MQGPEQIDFLLFGGVILVGLIVVGLISLFAFRRVPTVEELAKSFRLSLDEKKTGGDVFLLQGDVEGLRAKLRQHTGLSQDYWTSWELELPDAPDVWLTAMRRSCADGLSEVVTRSGGDPKECIEVNSKTAEFDDDFCLFTDHPSGIEGILTEDIRELIMTQPELMNVVVGRGMVRVSACGLPRVRDLVVLRDIALSLVRNVTSGESGPSATASAKV